jgi:uncharacterized membrane protein
LRRYLVTGLLIWLPLGITIFVFQFLVRVVDRVVLLLPPEARPNTYIGFDIPGVGIVLVLIVLLVTGIFATNFFGRRMVAFGERVVGHIPLVRTVYLSAKQVVETVFSGTGKSFRKVLLVPYPNADSWTIAFLTSSELGEVQEKTGREVVGAFIPTAPNPTSGYILMFPKDDVVELEMTVEEAFKMIISLGVVVPAWPRTAEKPAAIERVLAHSATRQ